MGALDQPEKKKLVFLNRVTTKRMFDIDVKTSQKRIREIRIAVSNIPCSIVPDKQNLTVKIPE